MTDLMAAPVAAVRVARPHQQQALTALGTVFANGARAQLVMACGTGKTLVGRWYAQQINAAVTVVVVPSLNLLAQTVQEWRADVDWLFETLITCSDPSTANSRGEDVGDRDDVALPFWATMRARVSTNVAVVADRLIQACDGSRPIVIFSTYHSVHVVAEAARHAGVSVDLVLADEAHLLAGQSRPEFRVVLGDQLPARRRLCMTATPVIKAAVPSETDGAARWSMDDTEVFGPVAYRLDFAEAIAHKLLADYQVCIFETPGHGHRPDPVAALIAASRRGVSSVLSFHGRVAKARAFAAAIDGLLLPDGRRVVARAVAGTDSAVTRAQALSLFSTRSPDELVVVSSAQCLTAGVDIPSVDGVLFADPKDSDVDVVQAVGRALRPAPGKTTGLVMIPVCVPADLDDDSVLSSGAFATVWRILRGLRSMDPRLVDEVVDRNQGGRPRTARLDVDFSSVDAELVRARLVDFLSPAWERRFAQLQAFAAVHGHSRPQNSSSLGVWCYQQQRAYRTGALDEDRARRLSELAGWAWDRAGQRWREQCEQIRATCAAHGGLDLSRNDVAEERLRCREPRRSSINTVGRWCAHQRQLRRRGELAGWQVAVLDEIVGWQWDLLGPDDAAAVDLLREYVAWKGHANPPADFVDDDIALGRWLNGIRRRKVTRTLPRALVDELDVVCPAASHRGALRWYGAETRWLLGVEALRQFVGREGHCRIPPTHVENLADYSLSLHSWFALQRQRYLRGELNAVKARLLQAAAGGPIVAVQRPQAFGVGTSRHVRARSAGAGEQWVDARRTWDLVKAMLSRGWTKAWIARELGIGNELSLHSDMVTTSQAAAVVDLAARVGTLHAPPRRGIKPLPSLAEILAEQTQAAVGKVA